MGPAPNPEISFTYDQVETALAKAFSVPDDKVKALRARLRHYANLGIAPAERPGKGKHISYKFEDAVIWAIALDFSHLGFGPKDVVGFLQHSGTRQSLRKVFLRILQDLETGIPQRFTVALIKTAPLFDESMPSRIRMSLIPQSRLEIDVSGDDHIAAFNITARFVALIFTLRRACGMDMLTFLAGLTREAEMNSRGNNFETGTIIEFKRESA